MRSIRSEHLNGRSAACLESRISQRTLLHRGLQLPLKPKNSQLGRHSQKSEPDLNSYGGTIEHKNVHMQLPLRRFKNTGNDAFKRGDHEEAVRLYTAALEVDPDNHVLYSNRSAAYLASGDAKSKVFHHLDLHLAL